ncbi:binder of sperm protein homolog 1 [Acomys russatus]|uniref:binder of sperm protein homolog 1 n=1 Tax=Acomys russatus TaxID=60746 RepID=UPI0021E269F5|nr:binder of sperm protein homolog 1 [Acomys russatus]
MAQPVGFLLVSICLFHSLFSLQEEEYYPPTIDGECAFPFSYRNKLFYDCVDFNAKHKWCSLNKTFQGYWKYCSLSDYAPCAFPFWYRRLIYWDCTEDGDGFGKKWCSLTPNYNKDKVWKYCT